MGDADIYYFFGKMKRSGQVVKEKIKTLAKDFTKNGFKSTFKKMTVFRICGGEG